MHDRAVRRRRATVIVLVALSLVLLTAYFGESPGGSLHSVQRGAMEVLAPVQEGANRAVKPFRDLFRWFGDTLDAKSQRDQLKQERDALRREVADLALARQDLRQLEAMRAATGAQGLDRYQPVAARVISRSPSVWYSTLEINKGSSDGIRADQPVINGEGLVGKVKSVSGGSAVVMLLTDQDFGVSARALGVTRGERNVDEPGTISPAVGAPGDLLFELVPRGTIVNKGDQVVTAGTSTPRLQSLFPRGILIGTVKRVDIGEGELDRKIHVAPAADLRRLDFVQVLTQPEADLRASVRTP